MITLRVSDLVRQSGGKTPMWRSKYGHQLQWFRDSGAVTLRLPDGEFFTLEPAASAVEAKQRYVNFKKRDQ